MLSLPLALLVAYLAWLETGSDLLLPATMGFSLLACGGLGLGLAWASWRSLQNRPATKLHLPAPGVLILSFPLALIAGEVLRDAAWAPALFPPWHVLASLLPPLVMIAAATQSLQWAGARLSRRDLVRQFAYGALGATLVSIFLEGASFLGVGVTSGLLLVILPGGQESLETLSRSLQSPTILTDPQALLTHLPSPGLLAVAGLIIISLLVPLIEEIVKSLGVLLSGAARGRLDRAQAFALGLMAGAGFSLVEALFYGASSLPVAWSTAVLTRAATVVIHGLATGLMGLGWHALLTRRSRPAFASYALAAMLLHGTWNAGGGLLALASLQTLFSSPGDFSMVGVGLSVLVAAGLLLLIFILAVVALIWFTRRLAVETALNKQRKEAKNQ